MQRKFVKLNDCDHPEECLIENLAGPVFFTPGESFPLYYCTRCECELDIENIPWLCPPSSQAPSTPEI